MGRNRPRASRYHRHSRLAVLAFLLTRGLPAPAQTAPAPAIQDNSFLLEEAYNQEEGVVQTIQTFTRDATGSGAWTYAITQEWPVPALRHQLSFSLPVQGLDAGSGGARGVGDLALNYRYQLVGDGDAKVAVSPRLSALVPTGSEERGLGTGSWGVQVGLPLSLVLTPRLVSHTNLGGTFYSRSTTWSAGQSLVWLAHPNLNVLVEGVYTHTEDRPAGLPSERREDVWISPGLRAAINLGTLQIVPGIAMPIGAGPTRGQRSVFLYLSFEHPLWTAKARS